MRRRVGFGSVGIVGLLVLSSAALVAADEVVVIDQTLEPALLEVESGTTVVWENRDDERHRVRSKDGPARFDSKNLEPGDAYRFTFSVPGSYPYYDHRDRNDAAYFGTVVVGGASSDAAPLESGAVSIADRSFQPPALRLVAGGTVIWTNDDGEAHTITSTDDAFDSGIVGSGETFDQVFDEPGDHPYFCLIHPEMRGIVTVVAPDELTAAADQNGDGVVDGPVEFASPDLDGALSVLTDTETAEPLAVAIEDLAFQPESIEARTGGTVQWTNVDPVGHTVTSVDGAFDSGVLTVDSSFDATFDTAGSYDYFCAIHPSMTGTVIVSE